ncbi:hypothetical protein EXM65_18955 [Clostridium botulinum]|uniref:Uncharacterized protein n=1 Tax=Clostridium botulinum TaxID=1491 RepID=A0A6M0STF8_CLOBO|nr:hypothetical protein [Clostridium botulinum]
MERYNVKGCGFNTYGYKSEDIKDVPKMIEQCLIDLKKREDTWKDNAIKDLNNLKANNLYSRFYK